MFIINLDTEEKKIVENWAIVTPGIVKTVEGKVMAFIESKYGCAVATFDIFKQEISFISMSV